MTASQPPRSWPRPRHVDLHCWIAFFTRLLSRLSRRLGMGAEAEAYASDFDSMLASLVPLHWHPDAGTGGAFCDHGVHANRGTFDELIVVKCATADGSAQIEHLVRDPRADANPRTPECPRSHPKFLFPLGDGSGGLLTREKFVPSAPEAPRFVERLGYVSLFPLLLRLLPASSPQLLPVIELIRDPAALWSPHGVRSLSRADEWYKKQNAPGDEPYWRGPIWINLNYLVLSGLHHYASVDGPARGRAAEVYAELRANLVANMLSEWKRTGYLWEHYDPESGRGSRTHPFNGWSSLVLCVIAEIY